MYLSVNTVKVPLTNILQDSPHSVPYHQNSLSAMSLSSLLSLVLLCARGLLFKILSNSFFWYHLLFLESVLCTNCRFFLHLSPKHTLHVRCKFLDLKTHILFNLRTMLLYSFSLFAETGNEQYVCIKLSGPLPLLVVASVECLVLSSVHKVTNFSSVA